MLVPMSVVMIPDMTKEFLSLVKNGTLTEEMALARTWVQAHVSDIPRGVATSIRKPAEVKQLIDDGTPQVLFAGTLKNIALSTPAHRTLDAGRIRQLLGVTTTVELCGQIGAIIVNRDTWTEETAAVLHRCDKDAEIDTLCLLLYWCRDNDAVLAELIKLCTDLVFDCRKWGSGSRLFSKKTRQADTDEDKKKTTGMSSWRLSIFFCEFSNTIKVEGRAPDAKTEAKKVSACLAEDNGSSGQWSEETISRHLSLGSRIESAGIQSLLHAWECRFGREALIDTNTVLRAAVGAAQDDTELMTLLQILFLEQCAGVRTAIKSYTGRGSNNEPRTPANIMKSVLIREAILTHLKSLFGNMSHVIESYSVANYLSVAYGINDDGTKRDDFDENANDDEADEGAEGESNHASSYRCSSPLVTLLKGLVQNNFERTLCIMAKENNRAKAHVDLTTLGAKTIYDAIAKIQALYNLDFPSPIAPVVQELVSHSSPGASSVTVQVHASAVEEIDESTYTQGLKTWNNDVAAFEKRMVSQYLNAHIQFAIHNDNQVESLKRKLGQLPLMNEKKRKFFQLELANTQNVDWEMVKRQRKSMFHPVTTRDADDAITALVEVYSKFRTEDDKKESEDTICIIVPGPQPNVPVNKPMELCYRKLSGITPAHQPPKIGKIEIEQADVMRRFTGVRAAFGGQIIDEKIFTTQKKNTFVRKTMKKLGGAIPGDSYFNRWLVKTIPLASMRKCELEVCNGLFNQNEFVPFLDTADCPHHDACPDEVAMSENQVVPFPHEHEMNLAVEQQHIFEVKIFVDLAPGSGEKAKAYLSMGLHCVLVCMTPNHKADKSDLVVV